MKPSASMSKELLAANNPSLHYEKESLRLDADSPSFFVIVSSLLSSIVVKNIFFSLAFFFVLVYNDCTNTYTLYIFVLKHRGLLLIV